MFYVRMNYPLAGQRMGPKQEDHPTVGGYCLACGVTFFAGDFTTLVPLGPGHDEDAQAKCRARRFYNAVAVEVHYACAGGVGGAGKEGDDGSL